MKFLLPDIYLFSALVGVITAVARLKPSDDYLAASGRVTYAARGLVIMVTRLEPSDCISASKGKLYCIYKFYTIYHQQIDRHVYL
jgi:hypothetical protein